jgi:predicted nucleic acid-binding protein
MGRKYLLDSNVVIDYMAELYPRKTLTWLNKIINQEIITSVITKIEVLSYDPDKGDNYEILVEFFDAATILNLTDDIVAKTIEIRQKNRIKLPDAVIAASAILNNLALITRNVRDFQKIDDLIRINPLDLPDNS